jgi:hypothetical protein
MNPLQLPIWGDVVGGNDPIASHLELQAAAATEVSCGLTLTEFIGGDHAQVLAASANWTNHKKIPP